MRGIPQDFFHKCTIMMTHRNTWMLAALLLVCAASAFAQETQERHVPAQRVVAQSGKAQELKWNIITTNRISVEEVRLDSLLADRLYAYKQSSRYERSTGQASVLKRLFVGDIEKMTHSSSMSPWYSIGGAFVTSMIAGGVNSSPYGNTEFLRGALLGGAVGFIIGAIIDNPGHDSYDLTKKTTAEKWLLLTDLLVSGASSRK